MSEFSGTTGAMDDSETLYYKGIEAAKRYLEVRGFEIYEVDPDNIMQIVAYNDEEDCLHFIHVFTKDDMNFNEPESVKPTRSDIENKILHFTTDNSDFVNCNIQFDEISIVVVGEHRALLRHYHNAYSSM